MVSPETAKLLASRMSVEEMADFIRVDSLGFLSIDGLYGAMGVGPRDAANPQFTDHYFTGDYPTRLVDREIEEALRRVCEPLDIDLAILWQWSPTNPQTIAPTHVHYTGNGVRTVLGGSAVAQDLQIADADPHAHADRAADGNAEAFGHANGICQRNDAEEGEKGRDEPEEQLCEHDKRTSFSARRI